MSNNYYNNILLENYNKILYGDTEFYKNINNKIYYIFVITDEKNEIYMNMLFKQFIIQKTKNKYVAIDFEFNKISKTTRDVALMQINLEDDYNNIGLIFLLNPDKLIYGKKTLIDLLIDNSSKKILHGSESLDMPYLYNTLLETDENILDFNKTFFDTKYICEYKRSKSLLDNVNKPELKCSIYEMLLYFKIITISKLTALEYISDEMEKLFIYGKNIDIYNLDNYILDYSMYDVLFLPELMRVFYKNKSKSLFLIKDIFNYVNINKRTYATMFNKIDIIINKINNYFIIYNGKSLLLNTLWSKNYDKILNIKYIKYIYTINYYKSFFKTITKYMLYYNISKQHRIFSKMQMKYDFDYFDILEDLRNYKYIREYVKKIIKNIKELNIFI